MCNSTETPATKEEEKKKCALDDTDVIVGLWMRRNNFSILHSHVQILRISKYGQKKKKNTS